MKKFISIILVAVIAFSALSLTACGNINDSEIAILWADNGSVTAPDSLINCIERAMYIENIGYTNYGADNNAETQYSQAKSAVDADCAALIIELVKSNDADKFVELAKGKNIPIIFIGTVADSVIESYDKCFAIATDSDSIAETQGKLIASYVSANFKDLDRNEDGKISYVSFSSDASIDYANNLLKNGTREGELSFMDNLAEITNADYAIEGGTGLSNILGQETKRTELIKLDVPFSISVGETVTSLVSGDTVNVELIVTNNDSTAFEVLKALQSKDYNTDKLTTHYVPIFTVGFEMDYKNYVLSGVPEIDSEYVILPFDSAETLKIKISKYEEAIKAHYESNKFLCDLTAVEEADVEIMIWNTKNVIASGRISGTVIEDQDTIAGAIAAVCRNLINNKAAFDGLNEEYINENGREYLIPFIAN